MRGAATGRPFLFAGAGGPIRPSGAIVTSATPQEPYFGISTEPITCTTPFDW